MAPGYIFRFAKLLLAIVPAAVIFGCFVLFVRWGEGQAFTPQIIEQKLVVGMAIRDSEAALGLLPGSIAGQLQPSDDGSTVAKIAEPGWGAMFVPQYGIDLRFGHDGRLVECLSEVHWRCDENRVVANITPP